MKKISIVLILWAVATVLQPFRVYAETEQSEKMTKITTRCILPFLPEDSFGRKPQTYYRIGSHFARTEELPDVPEKIHGLIISNNRDSWMINLLLKSGKHIVDREPTYDIYMPILPLSREIHEKSDLKYFEFGHEIEFLRKYKAKERTEIKDGEKFIVFSLEKEDFKIDLWAKGTPLVPFEVKGYSKEGELVVAFHYDEYLIGLEPDMGLFQPPTGIEIIDVN